MLGLDAERAAWARRMGGKASLTASEVWGLRMLAGGSDGPLSRVAARAALAEQAAQ